MSALVLPIGPIFSFSGNRVSDHNRQPLQITSTRIENRKRMADGTLRTFVVAKPRQFKCSWKNLPRTDNRTVDGFWGADSINNFYSTTNGSFTLTVVQGDNTSENITVIFADCSLNVSSRTSYVDLYDVDITMDEVSGS